MTSESNQPTAKRTWLWVALAIYILIEVALAWYLVRSREVWVNELENTPGYQESWDQYRENAKEGKNFDGSKSSVQRRVPKSDKPPELVLLKDHFKMILVAAFFFSSLMYWFVAFLVNGIFRSPGYPASNLPAQ